MVLFVPIDFVTEGGTLIFCVAVLIWGITGLWTVTPLNHHEAGRPRVGIPNKPAGRQKNSSKATLGSTLVLLETLICFLRRRTLPTTLWLIFSCGERMRQKTRLPKAKQIVWFHRDALITRK